MSKVQFGKYDYEVTKMSLLCLQVCSDCPVSECDELEKAVQKHDPAGTTHNWQIEKEGKLAPVQCAENPDRMHYVFCC